MKRCMILTLAGILLAFSSLRAAPEDKRSDMEQIIRKPAVAGQFYMGNPAALRTEVEKYLEAAEAPAVKGEVIAIVSPHAGYMYSGHVAAHGFSLIRGKDYETVVVISPSHVDYFNFCSVFNGKSYMTPLGEIPVDHELAELIASKSDQIKIDTKGHIFEHFERGEHALEVQLPFLQVALDDFKLVPIVMGDQGHDKILALGEALGDALKDRKALIVASTDLSHFHDDKSARRLDGVFMEKLKGFDPEKLYDALADKDTEACGGGPTVAAIIAARKLGAELCEVLHYANSGDVTGDTRNVVGYVSAVMLKKKAQGKNPENTSKNSKEINDSGKGAGTNGDADLSREDKVFLLTLARRVIEAEFQEKKVIAEEPKSPIMKELRGAFVTLKKGGQLRGCIGYIEAVKPLFETVKEMARAAAFNDWRFSPVSENEVDQLEIEISVLSPISQVEDPSTIEVGKHGIIITRGSKRGLLLPQVATEWGWDREKFLEQTCVKAGLPVDSWKQPGTKIEIFSAEIFSEEEQRLH